MKFKLIDVVNDLGEEWYLVYRKNLFFWKKFSYHTKRIDAVKNIQEKIDSDALEKRRKKHYVVSEEIFR